MKNIEFNYKDILKMFKVFISSVFIVICLEGCSTLKYAKQLLVLKDLSESQEDMSKYLDAQELSFKHLLGDIKNKKIELSTSKEDFLNRYGEPVFIRKGSKNFSGEVFLYRYPTKYFNSDKVYVYFDQLGKLVDWEYDPYP